MRYRPHNQPHHSPPVNHNPYQYHTSYSNQNWNGAEQHQTPYDLFAKPELPSQWSNQAQTNMDFVDPGSNPNMNANQDPNFNPNMNANQDPNFSPNMNANQDPNFNPNMNANQDPNFNPNMSANQGPNFNPNMNANPGQPSAGPMSYFQNGNGQLDFDKVLSTVGQIASTYHQVSPIIQQFSSLIKTFR